MKVFRTTRGLKLAIGSLWMHVPLMAGYELLMTQKSEWDDWLTPTVFVFTGLVALFLIPLSWALRSGKKGAIWAFLGFQGGWFILTVAFAFYFSSPALGFLGWLVLVLGTIQSLWILSELKKPFWQGRLPWYQGKPTPLPFIKGVLKSQNQALAIQITQLGKEGLFVSSPSPLPSSPEWVEITLQLEEHQVQFYAQPMIALERSPGLGLQIVGLSPNQKQEWQEWLQLFHAREGFTTKQI